MNVVPLLQEKGIIDAATAESVLKRVETEKISEVAALTEIGIGADTVRTYLGEYYDLPISVIEEGQNLDPKILSYLPEESARHYKMIPLRLEDGVLIVGVVDPENYGLRDALNFITAKYHVPYKLAVMLDQDFQHGLHSYENLSGEVGEVLDELSIELSSKEAKEKKEKKEEKKDNAEILKEDAPVTKIVATVLRYAVDGGASDIHIEPYDLRTVVRFRVDGVLMHSLELPKKVHEAVVARVKILASLRLDEKRKPQDGRFSATVDGHRIDFRVSILPTNHGEKVVMRILDTEKGVKTLEDAGVSEPIAKLIREAIQQPYGIVLISGPTGSGKSTTLYAMLAEVDRERKNVLSLEDPVEYDIDGVSQSQVRPEIGYTFATGLRTALRQDPDVIMVGEIRDKETAQLAIQAALTGHLVLSTIHTNNAIGTIPRLIDMGIDPYLIAPTLQLALAQRLVRRLCPNTGKHIPITGSIRKMIDEELKDLPQAFKNQIPETDYVVQAEPSSECATGTKGRIAVMEAVHVNDKIEQLILNSASEEEIYHAARENGFVSMKEDAIFKALEHTIPFEEVNTLGGDLMTTDVEEEDLTPVSSQEIEPITSEEVLTPIQGTKPATFIPQESRHSEEPSE